MNDKLTENNETPEVGAKPIFTIRERQKDETDEIKILSDQTADSVAMNGSEMMKIQKGKRILRKKKRL